MVRGVIAQMGFNCYWQLNQHLLAIGWFLPLSLLSGYLLTQNTDARMPYIDSFTTWGSVITTHMVARKVVENWISIGL